MTFAMRKRGLRAGAMDINYKNGRKRRHRSNFMDLTTASGFLLLEECLGKAVFFLPSAWCLIFLGFLEPV